MFFLYISIIPLPPQSSSLVLVLFLCAHAANIFQHAIYISFANIKNLLPVWISLSVSFEVVINEIWGKSWMLFYIMKLYDWREKLFRIITFRKKLMLLSTISLIVLDLYQFQLRCKSLKILKVIVNVYDFGGHSP